MASGLSGFSRYLVPLLSVLVLAASAAWFSGNGDGVSNPIGVVRAGSTGLPDGPVTEEQVLRGRELVIMRECGGCHGGRDNPAAEGWLAGDSEGPFDIGGYMVWPRNLTPDDETGLGRFSERQIFNVLRYGLRPDKTPDVEITSHAPGEGNFPAQPVYLSPGMPWAYWRYMPDEDLWAIAAYLKHGLKPVSHKIPEREVPPDLWAGASSVEAIGTPTLPPFPTQREELRVEEKREQVLRGRQLASMSACSGCHGGGYHPGQDSWLTGMLPGDLDFEFKIGPFKTRPRNLTPHNTMGMGRFSERQIFNALRYGLRPGETADVAITSHTPGEGNFPMSPKFLAPPMPWPAWRHMPDQDLWDIAAYLKYGLKPAENRVADSEGPPDFWVKDFKERIGPYPAVNFPTDNERRLGMQ